MHIIPTATKDQPAVSANPSSPFDSPAVSQRVKALLRQMTLEEKIGQLVQFANGNATGPDNVHVDQEALIARGGMGGILGATGAKHINSLQKQAVEKSRLKIPLIFGLDVIHGYRTTFPVPLGLSASWDADLVEKTARVAAVEATSEGVRWTFSPMVDVARDARWGRIMEGAGEDPYLGGKLAAAYVRGYQGNDLTSPTAMVACAKHFVGYGQVEGGRDYNGADISERAMRDVHLPAFQAAVDAGVGTLMSAFVSVGGVPASANRHLLTEVLRGEWGFRGFVVSDWNSIGELVDQGIAFDNADAAEKAINAGVDMDMATNAYASHLVELVKNGRVKASVIDEAASRILRVKVAMGLFEHPYTDESRSPGELLAPASVELARQAAESSFVLLKNEKSLLPLSASTRVALIGPLADSRDDMLGGWACNGRSEDVVTLKKALTDRLGGNLTYAEGTKIVTDSEDGFAAALDAARKSDVVVMALGESRGMSGEARSRSDIGLPGNQLQLLKAVAALGKPVVLVAFSGRPLALSWEAEHVPAILEAWFPGVQAGPALARTLFGDVNPSGRLTASFPRSVGQLPLYYAHGNTGRPTEGDAKVEGYTTGYLDQASSPLFPFGYGLSYTQFDYTAPTVSVTSVRASDLLHGKATIEAEATITNSGARAGAEVVQFYIRERGTSVTRPVRELKGYEKVSLNAGESRKVKFTLTAKELSFWGIDLKKTVEPCELTVWIAPNASAGKPVTIKILP